MIMECPETIHLNSPSTENDLNLHKVFVDLSSENDLKEDELEWFKSKIYQKKVKDKKKEKKSESAVKTVKILEDHYSEPTVEKPGKLFIRLNETETLWLFSLSTKFSQDNAKDIERVHNENKTYSMKKVKKELVRKRCMADAQTPRHIEKTVGTLTEEIKMADAEVFASEWDLHDSYNALDTCELDDSKNFYTLNDSRGKKGSDVSNEELSEEEEAKKIFDSSKFKYASLVTERLLASNCYQNEQKVFKKKFEMQYDEEPTSFSYEMTPLWNYAKDSDQLLMVTDLDWNPLNPDLLAAAYGDLHFESKTKGLVCIWCPKNPRQPEREFTINDSVISLRYSQTRPNILAVGTRTGNIYVVDISTYETNIKKLGSSDVRPGPIWKVQWFLCKELVEETEELLVIGESGVLMRFSENVDKGTKDILQLDYVTTTKKLPEKRRQKKLLHRPPVDNTVFDKKIFSGLSFSILSDNNYCYVSTKEGVIVKCNMRNPSMNDGVFLAHDGPVYNIQHSPCTDLIYFTCGADCKIKIWMEGISEPLITLQSKTPVVSAKWSPTIPTMIASIGENEVSLWDFARNILNPKSVKTFENCEKPFTVILFSFNGKNLIIGGEDGLARVVHLTQLPRIPFLQKEALISAIRKALLRNEDHKIKLFTRAVEENRDKLETNIIECVKKGK